jgi:hypothetical protein
MSRGRAGLGLPDAARRDSLASKRMVHLSARRDALASNRMVHLSARRDALASKRMVHLSRSFRCKVEQTCNHGLSRTRSHAHLRRAPSCRRRPPYPSGRGHRPDIRHCSKYTKNISFCTIPVRTSASVSISMQTSASVKTHVKTWLCKRTCSIINFNITYPVNIPVYMLLLKAILLQTCCQNYAAHAALPA